MLDSRIVPGNNEFYMAVISGHGRWNDLTSNYGWSGFIVETPLDMKADAQMEYNGKIYKFYKSALPYATAERFCKETGGGLVKIGTKEENDAIAQKIKEIKGSFYIGASDEKKEGTFVWRDGTALTYSNWSSGEPNNSEGAGAETTRLFMKTVSGMMCMAGMQQLVLSLSMIKRQSR